MRIFEVCERRIDSHGDWYWDTVKQFSTLKKAKKHMKGLKDRDEGAYKIFAEVIE